MKLVESRQAWDESPVLVQVQGPRPGGVQSTESRGLAECRRAPLLVEPQLLGASSAKVEPAELTFCSTTMVGSRFISERPSGAVRFTGSAGMSSNSRARPSK